jgi:hypothetical protein
MEHYDAPAIADPFAQAASFFTCLLQEFSGNSALGLPHHTLEEMAANVSANSITCQQSQPCNPPRKAAVNIHPTSAIDTPRTDTSASKNYCNRYRFIRSTRAGGEQGRAGRPPRCPARCYRLRLSLRGFAARVRVWDLVRGSDVKRRAQPPTPLDPGSPVADWWAVAEPRAAARRTVRGHMKKGNSVNTEKIMARRLTTEEVSELGLQEDIFVSAEMDDLPLDCYAPAFLTKPGKNFEGGSFTARTIFGQEIHVLPDNAEEGGIWVADETGEEIEVLQSAGVLLNLALFVPSGNKESLESLYTAAREAFGAGIVQRWNEEVVAVPDVKVDLFEEPTRGRKSTSSQNRDRRALDIYPTRVRFMEPSAGWRFILEPHKEDIDDTPTI